MNLKIVLINTIFLNPFDTLIYRQQQTLSLLFTSSGTDDTDDSQEFVLRAPSGEEWRPLNWNENDLNEECWGTCCFDMRIRDDRRDVGPGMGD